MSKEEIQLMFAHAMLTGLAQNGHLLTANASGESIGEMVGQKAYSIAEGYVKGLGDVTPEPEPEANGEYT